jgi:hypothetical protein
MSNRPANESNSIVAQGYALTDLSVIYKIKNYKMGLFIENMFNVEWNEAQFATRSRLQTESAPVEEIHFTPGTPFSLKLLLSYSF